ncbi:hypothetical protein OBBRIDRAFT_812797 [Obba rivulosa]|uniref:P-loop containing nucleoside triphosphate hydrolase protein n=1 Tax=Obba rivulosa TaxID=1052685 RepID=A0A8E2DNL1_9APHY|nr:hypothetical protein OBBRIDRAFT_812797 [Obba rivulosa]
MQTPSHASIALVPVCVAAVSGVLLTLQLILRSKSSRSLLEFVDTDEDVGESYIEFYTKRLGGLTILTFGIARLLCCLALLALTLFSAAYFKDELCQSWLYLSLCGTYAYTLILGLLSIFSDTQTNRLARKHIAVVLLVTWGTYMYRDVWPLATYTLTPVDAAEGWLLWIKFALLSVAAVVVPLLSPRRHVSINPKSLAEPNPEQTASLLSMALFSYVDSMIAKAQGRVHLPLDEMPPTADYDMAEHLAKKSHPYLDPLQNNKERHLFWSLLRIFRNVHSYLETDGHDAVVRPWVWISWLFLGPAVGAITSQLYLFVMMRVGIRIQAIIISLVFDHALRMRVAVEDDEALEAEAASNPSVSVTPDAGSISERASVVGEVSVNALESSSETVASDAGTHSGPAEGEDKQNAKSPEGIQTPAPAARERTRNLVGKLNNLVTVDAETISTAGDFLSLFLVIPLQTALSIWFLYTILGWRDSEREHEEGWDDMRKCPVLVLNFEQTDARIQTVTESMSYPYCKCVPPNSHRLPAMQIIRMIKVFGWERLTTKNISEKCEEELAYIKQSKMIYLVLHLVNWTIQLMTMLITYAIYVNIYTGLVFDVLRGQLYTISTLLRQLVQGKISLDRISDFLRKTELLDQFSTTPSEAVLSCPDNLSGVIGIRQAAFTWNKIMTRGGPGRVNLILGPTASGKTSLLMALLGEMHCVPLGPDSFVSLPRDRGVAYAAQESWVQNDTIRDNILFTNPYNEERYHKVIHQCALERDLSLFDAGDQTEVGERGITLSRCYVLTPQLLQARITLARAIYSSAEILLLDDVFSALDVHTTNWIVDKCFAGDLVRGRTVILVTHNVALTRRIAHFVVSMSSNGRIASRGTMEKALTEDAKLLTQLAEETTQVAKTQHDVEQSDMDARDGESKKGTLVVEEEVAVGHVGWSALKLYLSSVGGTRPYLFWSFCLGAYFLSDLTMIVQSWFLGYWAQQYEDSSQDEVNVAFYLGIYTVLLLLLVVLYGFGFMTYVYGSLRTSRKIHQDLITSVLTTTLRWLDKTPTSRILARCTQDIDKIDGRLMFYFWYLIEETTMMSIRFCAIIAFSPLFVIPGTIITVLGGWCGQLYMKAQLCVKREMSNANAPMLGHFGAAIDGLTSIRAYGAQDAFRQEIFRRINRYTRVSVSYYDLERWVSLRLDALGGLFAASLAAYLVYGRNMRASNTGFSLAMAVDFSGMILWWIRIFNTLERIYQYLMIEHEPEPSKDGIPPAYWPSSGALSVERFSAKYSPDGPLVLQDISFEVQSGERVGIVGRTGSGKSSLTLALPRCIITEGKPELLKGNLRRNLDPFEQYDDAVLNDALRTAGFFSLHSESDGDRLSLDSQIASRGSNLSVGQRQIIALARAIVRQSRLLILDEDFTTDADIQRSLRDGLGKDVTLLIVAHRLQTIADTDKIVEFGKPSKLLKDERGVFRGLVEESDDRDVLYSLLKSD